MIATFITINPLGCTSNIRFTIIVSAFLLFSFSFLFIESAQSVQLFLFIFFKIHKMLIKRFSEINDII